MIKADKCYSRHEHATAPGSICSVAALSLLHFVPCIEVAMRTLDVGLLSAADLVNFVGVNTTEAQ